MNKNENTTLTPRQIIIEKNKTKAHLILKEYLSNFDTFTRRSNSRKIILDIIYNASPYITFDEISTQMIAKELEISLSTIYKIVNLFIKAGLVAEIPMGKGMPVLHAAAIGRETGVTIRCLDCGTSSYMKNDAVKEMYEKLEAKGDFSIIPNSLSIPVRCNKILKGDKCKSKK